MPAMTMSHRSFVSFLMPMKKPSAPFCFWTKPSMGRHSRPHMTIAKITFMKTALAAKKVRGVSPPEPLEVMGAFLVWLCCSSKARVFAKAVYHH